MWTPRRCRKISCPSASSDALLSHINSPRKYSKPPIAIITDTDKNEVLLLDGLTISTPEFNRKCRSQKASPTSKDASDESQKRKKSMRKLRYYGTVEQMVSVDSSDHAKSVGCYRVEPAESIRCDIYQGDEQLTMSPIMVEDPENETKWYYRYFLGKEHQNFAGIDNQKSPYFTSVLVEETSECTRCRAILWRNTGSKKLTFQLNHPISQRTLMAKSIVHKFPDMNDVSHSLKEITDPKLQKDLLILEEQEGAANFKFGVIYAINGQNSDDEMLSNENGSESFNRFLDLLGDRIQLQGWTKFRGGLDNKANSTGSSTVYSNFEGHEIMFHVSTMLPYSQGNRQQVERKRHIGNDIVNIIFTENGDSAPNFKPSFMKSQFTHIFAVVTFDKIANCYRLWVYSEETVPAYGPALPSSSEFHDPAQFRDFLLTKLINGEKAAFRSHVFAEKRHRTTDTLIKDMYMEYLKKELNKGSIQKMTDAAVRHLKSPKNKEFDHNLMDFLRMGEHLKLTKSLSGEPSNVINGIYRKQQPWEPQLLCDNLPQYEILSSDSWSNRSLLYATENAGTLFINEGVRTTLLDSSCAVQQLNVFENFGVMIVRCEKGKDSYVSVFSLSHLRNCIRSAKTLQRSDCLENRISGTKGCHSYSVSGYHSFRLSLAVAIGRKLTLYRWKLSQITQLPNSTGLASNFEVISEIALNDDPISMFLFESGLQASPKAALTTKNELNLVDFNEYSISTIYKSNQTKMCGTNLIVSSDVESEDVLLTDSNTTLVFDLCDETSRPLTINWTSNPQTIAYCFPFVLGFGMDTIEIRLGINGNLFTSLYMPGVRLLASKEDIFFATYDSPWPLNDSRYNRSAAKTSVVNNSSHPPKLTCTLYKISLKNLLKGGKASSPKTKLQTSPFTTGSVTPIVNRFIFTCMSNDINDLSGYPQNTPPSTRKCTKGSETSDSGCSRGMGSTEDSIDLFEGSPPPSPILETSGDVLL